MREQRSRSKVGQVVVVEAYERGRSRPGRGALGRDARTAFAAACAERLWPLVERYASAISLPEGDRHILRSALDLAWEAAGGCGREEDMKGACEVTESLVPYEDEDWVLESGYAQNGIAAIAYAIRSWLSDDPQEAVWAARQVYEAADYGAQRSRPATVRAYSAEVEAELARTPVVQAAVRGISEDLVFAGKDSVEVVRQRAQSAAECFVALFP